MDDGVLISILNDYQEKVIPKLHSFICEVMGCEPDSVRGEYVMEYLNKNKNRIHPVCPLCGSDFTFVSYTDCRTGFICKCCKASGTNYVGGF